MIRPAEPADIAGVLDLIVAAELFAPDETAMVDELLSAFFAGAAQEARGFLVDVEERELVGVAYYQPKTPDGVCDLTMIAVAPAWQGQGRGRALLEHVEEVLRADGQRLLLVETSGISRYDGTRAFYENLAYDEVGRIADYWEPGDALVLFTKRLDGTSSQGSGELSSA